MESENITQVLKLHVSTYLIYTICLCYIPLKQIATIILLTVNCFFSDDSQLISRILYNRQPLTREDDSEFISKLENLLKDLKEKRNVFPENNALFKKRK